MHKMTKYSLLVLLTVCLCMALSPVCALAASPVWTNEETGYGMYIDDAADLLTEEEEQRLRQHMQEITEYGNAAFVTTSENNSSAKNYAENWYYSQFRNDSGTLFLIDMDNRMIYICSNGAVYREVTNYRAETITDNVFRLATKKDYYGCAREAYDQIVTLLRGGKIAQPMKYVCNILLALVLSVMINFLIVSAARKQRSASVKKVIQAADAQFHISKPVTHLTSKSKRYDPISSDSGSSRGGGGGYSGGGGGGGGFSGGGGGHSF